MHQVQKLIGALALALGGYIGLAWFFFGSPHPCGILEARQKPYVLEASHELSSKQRRTAFALLGAGKVQEGTMILEGTNAIPGKHLDNLRKWVWGMTPAQCAWRAIAWDVNPYKKPPLTDEEFLKTLPDAPKKETGK